jgi:hypothetical protein
MHGFSFYLPPDDTTTQQFLPQFPINPIINQDFVIIDSSGHFSKRNQPIRFFGTNLVADGAFPTRSKAYFIAGRLRKLGFNLIRLHHLDNPWSIQSIFEWGQDTRHLNTATLDRLENLISELKKNGVFIDVNLHVGRSFNILDGVPDADSIADYGKGVTQFDPQLIALQKEYARELLTHINPYTGLPLYNDPVMAMVEITNENSLYRMWRDGLLKSFHDGGILAMRHVRMLDSLWIAFLRQKYSTTDSIRAIWSRDIITGANQIRNGTFEAAPLVQDWNMEVHSPAQAVMSEDSVNVFSGQYSAKINVRRTDGIDWHLQWKQVGLQLVKDSLYTISFSGRADSTREFSLQVMKDIDPWTTYAVSAFTLTPVWQTFSFQFIAPESCLTETRLSFMLGVEKGTYLFDDIKFVMGGLRSMGPNESLDAGTIHRIDYSDCPTFTNARVIDISSFYITLEQDFFRDMVAYIKDSLGVKVPLVGTNWNVGPADLVAQSSAEYVDNHAYWQHPSFFNGQWSSTDWQIDNTPMVRSMSGGIISSLMAGVAQKNKPYTISEYDQPFPNRYQTEAPIFLTSYGSLHDVDAFMLYNYNQMSSDDWETDQVNGFFDNQRNSALMALMPSCAYAYRNGMIKKAEQTLTIRYSPTDYLLLPKKDYKYWESPGLFPPKIALNHAIRVETFQSTTPMDFLSFPAEPVNPYLSDTKEISWNTDGLLSINTPQFVAITGLLNLFPNQVIGPVIIKSISDFGTLTWISLSGDSLPRSKTSLMTLSSKIQNTHMIWDGTTTVHDQWGTAPTSIEPLRVTLRLTINANYLCVYPLDSLGRKMKQSMTCIPSQPSIFDITLDQNFMPTLWFGFEALEAISVLGPNQMFVKNDWNLISLPVSVIDGSRTSIFPTALSDLYSYIGNYESQDTLRPGHGYWLKFPSAQVISILGTPIVQETVDVKNRWNLIGGVSVPVPVSAIISIPPGIVTSNFFGYTSNYITSDTIYPGFAYWVKAYQDGQLILSPTAQSPSNARIKIIPISELPPSPPLESTRRIELPKEYRLEQNYPNPFNPLTIIKYQLPFDSKVKLCVYDILGREVITLIDGEELAGYKSVNWNASSVTSAVYFYQLEATSVSDPGKSFTKVKKMLLIR